MIPKIENPKGQKTTYTNKSIQQRCRVQNQHTHTHTQNQQILYTNNEQAKKEKKKKQFHLHTIASKRIKYLGINLTK